MNGVSTDFKHACAERQHIDSAPFGAASGLGAAAGHASLPATAPAGLPKWQPPSLQDVPALEANRDVQAGDGKQGDAKAVRPAPAAEKLPEKQQGKIAAAAAATKKTRVVNIHNKSNGHLVTVNVMRPSKWGNPFPIVKTGPPHLRVSRAQVISRYRAWIVKQPKLLAQLPELKGQVLGCCCAPLACHADILAHLADKS